MFEFIIAHKFNASKSLSAKPSRSRLHFSNSAICLWQTKKRVTKCDRFTLLKGLWAVVMS